MTHTIAPPTLEELNERIDVLEANKVEWADFPNHVHVRKLNIELYCLYAVRDGVGAKRQTELEDANNACIELAAKHGYATGHGDTVGDIMREFNAQIPDRAQSPWMGIETAPKDGTEILGVFFRPRDEDFSPVLSGPWTTCFKDGKWRSSWDGEEVLEYMGDLGSEYKSPLYNPSHWMPLPAPPTHNSPTIFQNGIGGGQSASDAMRKLSCPTLDHSDAKASHNHGEGDPSVMPDYFGGEQ